MRLELEETWLKYRILDWITGYVYRFFLQGQGHDIDSYKE